MISLFFLNKFQSFMFSVFLSCFGIQSVLFYVSYASFDADRPHLMLFGITFSTPGFCYFLKSQVLTLKPIFHCDAKYLASGVGVRQCPQHQNFVLGIPTCWYLGANANLKFASPPTQNVKFALALTQNPSASQWNIGCVGFQMQIYSRWACTFHIFCVDFIYVWWPTQTQYPVEYGL